MKAKVNTCVLGMLISALIACCALGDEPPVAIPPASTNGENCACLAGRGT